MFKGKTELLHQVFPISKVIGVIHFLLIPGSKVFQKELCLVFAVVLHLSKAELFLKFWQWLDLQCYNRTSILDRKINGFGVGLKQKKSF